MAAEIKGERQRWAAALVTGNGPTDSSDGLENRSWGAERIHGELLKLGIRVVRSTIQKYLWRVREGLPRSQGWKTFLRNHGSQILACDFVQTYDLFFRAIFVYVIIELGSRRVVHFNVTRSPSDDWLAQQMREATPFGEGPGFLIKDNDKKYGERFLRVARGGGIEVIPTPIAAPRANAHCDCSSAARVVSAWIT